MDSSYSVEERVARFCEHGYEISGCTKFMEFLK
jgi:hypothetical protein